MRKKQEKRKKAPPSLLRAALRGGIMAVALSAVLLAVLVLLISRETIAPENAMVPALIALAAASFVGGFTGASGIRDKKLLRALLSGVIFCAMFLLIALTVGQGNGEEIHLTICAALLPALAAGILRAGRKQKKLKPKHTLT